MKRTVAKLVVGVAVVASALVVPMSGAFAGPRGGPPPRGTHFVGADAADEVSAAIAALFGSAPGADIDDPGDALALLARLAPESSEPPPFVCPPVCVDEPGDEIGLPDLG